MADISNFVVAKDCNFVAPIYDRATVCWKDSICLRLLSQAR